MRPLDRLSFHSARSRPDFPRIPCTKYLDAPHEIARRMVVVTTIFDPTIGAATRWKKGQPSPNPGGRPKSRLLSEALRARLGEVKPDDPKSRTYAEIVAENLIEIACAQGRSAVTAAAEIADRLEGRPMQRLDVNDITADLSTRSDAELQYHLDHGRWPEADELLELDSQQKAVEEKL